MYKTIKLNLDELIPFSSNKDIIPGNTIKQEIN